MNIDDLVAKAQQHARVSYVWDVSGMTLLGQRVNGRLVRIDPFRVEISASRRHRGSDLYVRIEGQTVRANGTPGQTRRSVTYADNEMYSSEDMALLPREYVPFLEAARAAEAAR